MSTGAPPSKITPQLVLRAYAAGMFPMAESADDPDLYWVDPEERGIFPLDGLNISRSLAKRIRSDCYVVTADSDFDAVIAACAASGKGRHDTWINAKIRKLYGQLHAMGFVHTIEARDENGALVGGLYGVALGGAFFGESMFHRATDASKVALAHLVARLRHGGFTLLDTQFVTPHLASLGAIEIPRETYHELLDEALGVTAQFARWPLHEPVSGAQVLEILKG